MLSRTTHMHFIGICGIGMSGIAKVLLQEGFHVSGCDQTLDPQRAQELQRLGCTIDKHESSICHDPSIGMIVRSSDVAITHPEIMRAIQRNIPVVLRAEILAQIMHSKIGITIAGAHGKTTTSSLLGHVLLQANIHPTVIVGGHVHSMNSNAQAGTGKYIVVESDESDRSFLLLPKKYSIVTNIDREHLNTYQDFNDIKKTFITFMNQLPKDGLNILCLDDTGIQSVLSQLTHPYISYGISPQATLQITDIHLEANQSHFNLINTKNKSNLGSWTINIPGHHNILNATAVIGLCLELGLTHKAIKNGLETFQGVDRRFTFKGHSKVSQTPIFDDYGHHPTELQVTMKVARAKTTGKLIVIFQPQRFSRTKHLWHEFIETLAHAPIDKLIITDIYPANEQPIDGIDSKNMVQAITQINPAIHAYYIPYDNNGQTIIEHIKTGLASNDLLLFQGAGKVNKLIDYLL